MFGGWSGEREMTTRTILFLLCILTSFPVWGEEITLSKAVELALAHAPAMKAADAGRDAAAQDRNIGRAGLLPRIDATGSYQFRKQTTRYDGTQNIFQPDLKSHDSTIGLRVVQPLFDLERWAGYREGELSAMAGEMQLRLERQRLILETAQAYLETATAQAALFAAKAKEEAARSLSERAQAMFEAGVAAVNERLDADARRDLARAERFSAESDLDQARSRLASLTGVEVERVGLPAIPGDVSLPEPARPDTWESRAMEDAISVRLARLQFQVAEAEELRNWGSSVPKVEAFAGVEGSRATTGELGIGSRTLDQSIGVQASLPLFAGGGDLARIRKSKKASLQAEFALQDDIRLARLTARQAFLEYSAAISRLKAMRQAVVSAKEASEAARAGHEVGLRTMTDVLDADERRFEAEKRLVEAEAQLVFAVLQLRASVGMLDSQPLPREFRNPLQNW